MLPEGLWKEQERTRRAFGYDSRYCIPRMDVASCLTSIHEVTFGCSSEAPIVADVLDVHFWQGPGGRVVQYFAQ
jgi:hypothetical protein